MRRKILVFMILMVLLCRIENVFAVDYYVKNGGNNNLDGKSDANAWATIAKINGYAFQVGDQILFKRGGIWREELIVPSNGLTFDAYGTGDKPIISGADIVSGGWTLYSGNIYSATVSGTVYQTFKNSSWINLSHEPDASTLTDYYTDDGYNTTGFLVTENGDDMAYSGAQISGATLIAYINLWSRYAATIDSYSSNIVTLAQDGRNSSYMLFSQSHVPNPNRYWLANKLLFLDSPNEWYHNSSESRLYVYQAGGGLPSGVWEVTKRMTGISANTKDNITIKNINIKMAVNGISLTDCYNFNVDGNTIEDIGTQKYMYGYTDQNSSVGVYVADSAHRTERGTVQNNTITNCARKAVYGSDYSNVTVHNNTISNIAVIGEAEGMPAHGGMNSAINYYSSSMYSANSWVVTYNKITNCGYIGIQPSFNDQISYNTITNSMMWLSDGGAIYVGGYGYNNNINHNTIINPGGARNATGDATIGGIYLDQGTHDIVVEDNNITGAGYCLFSRHGDNKKWRRNICNDYYYFGIYSCDGYFQGTSNNNDDKDGEGFTDNCLITSKLSTLKQQVYMTASTWWSTDYTSWRRNCTPHLDWFLNSADMSGNTYYPDGSEYFTEVYVTEDGARWNIRRLNFDGWKSFTGLDMNSKIQSDCEASTPPSTIPIAPRGLIIK